MPRVKLRPYAVILQLSPGKRMTVRIWARDHDDAMALAPKVYAGTAVGAQHHPNPLP